MVPSTAQAPPQGGNQNTSHQEAGMLTKYNIYVVCTEDVSIQKRERIMSMKKIQRVKNLLC